MLFGDAKIDIPGILVEVGAEAKGKWCSQKSWLWQTLNEHAEA